MLNGPIKDCKAHCRTFDSMFNHLMQKHIKYDIVKSFLEDLKTLKWMDSLNEATEQLKLAAEKLNLPQA